MSHFNYPIAMDNIEKRIQNKINRVQKSIDIIDAASNPNYEDKLIALGKQIGLIELSQEFLNLKKKLIQQSMKEDKPE